MKQAPVQVAVNGRILKGFRERRSLSLEAVAKRLRCEPRQVDEIERDRSFPTYLQLESLSTLYGVSWLAFLFERPATITAHIPNFRSFAGATTVELSSDRSKTIERYLAKQIYLNALLDIGPAEFFANAPGSKSVTVIAQYVRAALGLSSLDDYYWRSAHAAYRHLVDRLDELGVYVMGFSDDTEDEHAMRGFLLLDENNPVVAVNTRDSFAARRFTVVHELAHGVLGNSSIDNILTLTRVRKDESEEVTCNQVAAEVLMPGSEMLLYLQQRGIACVIEEPMLTSIANRFRVSKTACAIKLNNLHMIQDKLFQTLMSRRIDPIVRSSTDTPGYITVCKSHNGKRMLRVLAEGYKRQSISIMEAGRALGESIHVTQRILGLSG